MATKKSSVAKSNKEKIKFKSTIKNKAVKADSIEQTVSIPAPLPVEPSIGDSKKIMAIISIIFGIIPLCIMIISLIFPLLLPISCCSFFFSIGAIILGILGRESQEKIGMGTIGIILGILGIVLPLCFSVGSMFLVFIASLYQ